MNINKSASRVLLCLLSGSDTAAAIHQQLQSIDLRSIQRSLVRLTELGFVTRTGRNNPTYELNYKTLLYADIDNKILEDEERPTSSFNFGFIDWLRSLTADELDLIFSDDVDMTKIIRPNTPMSARDLEYLTVELAWKSSSLEGNTYTLLDTQLLLLEGIKATNKTEFETQMIINHKDALAFIVEHEELFTGKIELKTVEEIHKIIGRNIGIPAGLRKRIVRISASNYQPIDNPHQIKENLLAVLGVISRAENPFVRALLALALVPYLQAFEDGNKRTGRMLANALLIHSIERGFSLRKVDAKHLALAYLAFYEYNSIKSLSNILREELIN